MWLTWLHVVYLRYGLQFGDDAGYAIQHLAIQAINQPHQRKKDGENGLGKAHQVCRQAFIVNYFAATAEN